MIKINFTEIEVLNKRSSSEVHHRMLVSKGGGRGNCWTYIYGVLQSSPVSPAQLSRWFSKLSKVLSKGVTGIIQHKSANFLALQLNVHHFYF